MPPRGAHLAPRAYPHYRAGLAHGSRAQPLFHELPDGQRICIQTTQAYKFVVIAHHDLAHKYALACRHALREGYKNDYRAGDQTMPLRAYIRAREEAAYLRAYASPPEGAWTLLRWSFTQEAAATCAGHGGGERAVFWEPVNNGFRTSSWPIASMAHLSEPYPVPDALRFGYQPSEEDGTDE